jgi:hypothetical protein
VIVSDAANSPVPAPASQARPEGSWSGTTSTGRTLTAIVLSDGSYWILYSGIAAPFNLGGVIEGTGGGLINTFTSSDARDFNAEVGGTARTARVSATFVAKQTFDGTITYSAPAEVVSFTTTYNSQYDLTPTLASVAGIYSGASGVVGATESATVTVSPAGQVTGVGASGCQFAGTATPRPSGNVYDVAFTFAGSPCGNGTSSVNGVAVFDAASKRLSSAALNSGRTNGFVFIGAKP